jgi:hypothetical protein
MLGVLQLAPDGHGDHFTDAQGGVGAVSVIGEADRVERRGDHAVLDGFDALDLPESPKVAYPVAFPDLGGAHGSSSHKSMVLAQTGRLNAILGTSMDV